MPTRDLTNALDSRREAERAGATLLKKHKILPHPWEERMAEPYVAAAAAAAAANFRDLVIDKGTSTSISSSDTPTPRKLKHASRRIGDPPPTPPIHSRQSSGGHPATATVTATTDSTKTSPNTHSVPTTPPNQRSPPTPDVTPPRAIPLPLRNRPPDRYPSSRADSFKTAREHPYSSEEDEVSTARPVILARNLSATTVSQLPENSHKRKEVGLGLGLESDNEGATTPRIHAASPPQEFHVFDGEWAPEPTEIEQEWTRNFIRNVAEHQRPGQPWGMLTDGAADEVMEDNVVSPTLATKVARRLPLQERVDKHRKPAKVMDQVENETTRRRISSETGLDYPNNADILRFSTTSRRSMAPTVVEAMVVEAVPTRTRTLRHSKKNTSLRDFSSDQSTMSSAPNSAASNKPHILNHPVAKIPQHRHRSLTSNTTMTTTSSNKKSRRAVLRSGAIPVVVIPDRRSSTKSSNPPSLRSTSSRKTQRSMSLSSAPVSNSSKFNHPGYLESCPPRKRNMSTSAESRESVRTIDYPPSIPARRSSLSAPTSRNNSRTASLTAESLKAHDMLQPMHQNEPVLETLQDSIAIKPQATLSKDLGGQSPHLIVDHNGDPFFGKRLSTQVTPFSQLSYDTTGTAAEVSEAMAVPIFPHHNRSLLVVQQSAVPDSSLSARGATESSQRGASRAMLNDQAVTGPVTPPQPTFPIDEVESPLRNPRVPPDPPAIKFIPATPSALTPASEEGKRLEYVIDLDEHPSPSHSKPKRGLSLVRRAFTTRRNSEPIMDLAPGFLKRTFSLSSRKRELVDESTQTSGGNAHPSNIYPSVADRPADGSRLHPFWRPSHFWDDLEDEGFADDELGGGYAIIDNRPAPPRRSLSGKLKRTFAILPIQDDHDWQPHPNERRTMRKSASGNLRVVKHGSNSSLGSSSRRAHTVAKTEREFAKGGQTIPGLGIRVEYIGWSRLKNKLNENRREQRTQNLRASISRPRATQSGLDDILRNHWGRN